MAYLASKTLAKQCVYCSSTKVRINQVVDPNGKMRRRVVCLNAPCRRVNK